MRYAPYDITAEVIHQAKIEDDIVSKLRNCSFF